jgi:hypothetical protein
MPFFSLIYTQNRSANQEKNQIRTSSSSSHFFTSTHPNHPFSVSKVRRLKGLSFLGHLEAKKVRKLIRKTPEQQDTKMAENFRFAPFLFFLLLLMMISLDFDVRGG